MQIKGKWNTLSNKAMKFWDQTFLLYGIFLKHIEHAYELSSIMRVNLLNLPDILEFQ